VVWRGDKAVDALFLPNEHSNFGQTMRQYTSCLNFLSLNIPEEIDTFSEEFDIL
jgi:hypothetical protein